MKMRGNNIPLLATSNIVAAKEFKAAIIEAHKDCCPMTDCVDCLFGYCREDCEYMNKFKEKIEKLYE